VKSTLPDGRVSAKKSARSLTVAFLPKKKSARSLTVAFMPKKGPVLSSTGPIQNPKSEF
jgi:hypothetical protein